MRCVAGMPVQFFPFDAIAFIAAINAEAGACFLYLPLLLRIDVNEAKAVAEFGRILHDPVDGEISDDELTIEGNSLP